MKTYTVSFDMDLRRVPSRWRRYTTAVQAVREVSIKIEASSIEEAETLGAQAIEALMGARWKFLR